MEIKDYIPNQEIVRYLSLEYQGYAINEEFIDREAYEYNPNMSEATASIAHREVPLMGWGPNREGWHRLMVHVNELYARIESLEAQVSALQPLEPTNERSNTQR